MKSLVGSRQPPALPRLKLRQRVRTCSSDSGCEVGCESPNDLLEDTLASWTGRLEGVLGQEVARARELTAWAKEALRQTETGDEERKEEVLESWRRQMEGVMEFTADLVECVNNDTKEVMAEALGGSSSPMETSLTIEEKEEDEEKEEEIMKLFWTPCIFPKSGEFPKTSIKTQKRAAKNKKDGLKDVGMKPLKPEFEGSNRQQKKRMMNNSKGYHIYKGLKMLESTLDSEEIFDDWNWNLWEFEMAEDIFADWRWNLNSGVDLRLKFYDDPMTEDSYNDFNFWSLGQPKVTEAMALGVLANDDGEAAGTPDSGCFSLQVEEEKGKVAMNTWLNCKYWEDSFQNESILHSLLEEEMQETDKNPCLSPCPVNFWDESANNQANIELIIKHEEKESKFLWDDKEIIFALVSKEPKAESAPSPQYFPWEDPDTMAGLLEGGKPSRRTSDDDSTFLWDDPAAIGMLLTDEEDEAYLPWDDKMDMVEELPSTLEEADDGHRPWEWLDKETLLSLVGEEPVHNTWEEWSLWDQFGSSKEIIQAYEEVEMAIHRPSRRGKKIPQVNIDEAFWNITMADSNAETQRLSEETENLPAWHSPDVYADAWDHDTPKPSVRRSGNQQPDPLNTFKAYRYIFYETDDNKPEARAAQEAKVETIYDDMLDIYADWAPNVLSDDRMEKKRQRRGRGRGVKVHRVPVALATERSHHQAIDRSQYQAIGPSTTVRRPGTPTIVTKKVNKVWDFDASWIETKHPKKARKTSQGWKTGRSQRQLHVKMHAKQPRSSSAAFPA